MLPRGRLRLMLVPSIVPTVWAMPDSAMLDVATAGYASVSPSASVNIAGLAPAAVPAVGGAYAGAGRYVANSAGVVHVAKREAEADADAFYGAYGLGYAGLGY